MEFALGVLKTGDPLYDALTIVAAHSPDRGRMVDEIWAKWFTNSVEKRKNDPTKQLIEQRNLANNVVLGMDWCGLADQNSNTLTTVGQQILSIPDFTRRHELFAKHLLENCEGFALLDAARSVATKMQRQPKNTEIHAELRRRGFYLPTNPNDPSKMRMWLEPSGIIDKDWAIDEAKLSTLLGTTLSELAEWQALTPSQRSFLEIVREKAITKGTIPIPATELVDAMRDRGVKFNEGQLRAGYYDKLSAAKWIVHHVNQKGRGAKGGWISAAPKLLSADVGFLAKHATDSLPADLRAQLNTPLNKIYTDLRSTDRHTKGIALELLTLNIAIDLGLLPLRLRVRGTKTGGNEVDLVAEGAHLLFSRWSFQCKNTQSVGISVLSREIGIATLLQSQVVVIVTTGRATDTVKSAARRITATTEFQVVIVEGDTIDQYIKEGSSVILDLFRGSASNALQAKRPQVDETLNELAEEEA
jgi:hypothetical protein